MDDLISRQAAIDAARDWYEGLICGSFKGLRNGYEHCRPHNPSRREADGTIQTASLQESE